MDIANWIVAVGTAGGAIASSWAAWAAMRGLNESKKYRMMSVRPIITFERSKDPYGKNFVGEFDSIASATYTFLIKNTGLGPAVLGVDPFRTGHSFDVEEIIKATQKGNPLPEQIIYPHASLPNVLTPDQSCSLDITLGYFSSKVMKTPWSFDFYYANINGSELWTTISIDPKTGDVMSLQLGPQEQKIPPWWQRIVDESKQI